MANLPPGTYGVEYSRGQGFFFPNTSTVAKDTSTASVAATVGTSLPATGTLGQQFYLTVAPGPAMYTWTGDQWQPN